MTAAARSTAPHALPLDRLRPVFIGGCPRSGTTLLGAMLGVGPDRLAVPESMFKFALLAQTDEGRISLTAARRVLSADPRFDLWRVPVPPRDGSTERPSLAVLLDGLVAAFARRVEKPEASIWIDHTPGNIRHASSLLALYPDARIINIVRDGRGVAASVLPLDWGPNRMADAAPWWASHVAMGLALAERYGEERVCTVRFEELVSAPETTLPRLCRFIDTPYDPRMISLREYAVDDYTVTDHSRVSSIPDPSRSRAWMESLSARQLEEFEYLTGELAEYLGYPLLVGPGATLPPRTDRLASFLTDVARRGLVDRLRRRRSEQRPR